MKKICSLLMVLMLLSTSVVFGSSSMQISPAKVVDPTEEAAKLISIASNEPSAYGLSGVDFNELFIGEAVNPCTETLEKINDVTYYPLIEKEKVVAILTVMTANDGSTTATLGTEFSKELNKFIKNQNEARFILIHSEGSIYIKNQKAFAKLAGFVDKSNKKLEDSLQSNVLNDEYLLQSGLKFSEIKANAKVPLTITGATYKRLDVPFVSQSNNLCWAATTAAIGKYKTGTSKTAKNVADTMGIGYDAGGTVLTVKDALLKIYKLNSTAGGYILSYSSLVSLIDNNKPAAAAFANAAGGMGHMVVFCGYSYSSSGSAIIVRDSNYTNYQLATAYGPTYRLNYYTGMTLYWNNTCYLQ